MITQTDYGNHPLDRFIRNILLTTPNKLIDTEMSLLKGEYVMDIYKLDKHLKDVFGYNEEVHGNLSEFIEWKFGKRVLNKIQELLFINY